MNWPKSRNITSHTYDQKKAEEIVELIRTSFFPLLLELESKLSKEASH